MLFLAVTAGLTMAGMAVFFSQGTAYIIRVERAKGRAAKWWIRVIL
jgi:hypothetical protein